MAAFGAASFLMFKRARLLKAVGSPCPYCGAIMAFCPKNRCPTRDHVKPRARGNSKTIVVCAQCNHDKGQLMPGEWYLLLLWCGDPRAPLVRHAVV